MPKEFIKQRNCTLTKEQQQYLKDNYLTKDWRTIAKDLGISYGRVITNRSVLGLERDEPEKTFEKNGFFNVDEFCKLYKW